MAAASARFGLGRGRRLGRRLLVLTAGARRVDDVVAGVGRNRLGDEADAVERRLHERVERQVPEAPEPLVAGRHTPLRGVENLPDALVPRSGLRLFVLR